MRALDKLKKFATNHRISAALIAIMMLVLLVSAALVVSFRAKHRAEPEVFGVTFSTKYAAELGLDWHEAYNSLMDEMQLDRIRLMSYWDIHEPAGGSFDFASLDEQMDIAHQHGVGVSLAIGLRQPRWPECHQPQWIDSLSEGDRQSRLLDYIETVVKRYRSHPALDSYQLENEVANRSFGECPGFDREFLTRELKLVRRLDPNHTVIINASNQSGVPLVGPIPKKVGFSVYRHAHFGALGRDFKWSYWYLPAAWHSLRAQIVEMRGAETFIHELQAEPWGVKPTAQMTLAEQNELMNPDILDQHVNYAIKTGMNEIHLWGAEYWYWRRVEFGDDSLWQAAKDILAR